VCSSDLQPSPHVSPSRSPSAIPIFLTKKWQQNSCWITGPLSKSHALTSNWHWMSVVITVKIETVCVGIITSTDEKRFVADVMTRSWQYTPRTTLKRDLNWLLAAQIHHSIRSAIVRVRQYKTQKNVLQKSHLSRSASSHADYLP